MKLFPATEKFHVPDLTPYLKISNKFNDDLKDI